MEDLQLLCNGNIIDKKKTNAILTVGKLSDSAVTVLTLDKPWEGDNCAWYTIFKDGDIYRMYYETVDSERIGLDLDKNRLMCVCYAESKDGINWVKPDLGLREFNGNKHNNIILDYTDKTGTFVIEGVTYKDYFDNLFVFKDTNPKCKKEELYKALALNMAEKDQTFIRSLDYFYSPDGIHFKKGHDLDIQNPHIKGMYYSFDTLNTCFYDENKKKYIAHIRALYRGSGKNTMIDVDGVRIIAKMESKDFIHWSKPESIKLSGELYPLYDNQIMPYPGNKNLYVGFPVRYVERKEWTDNYDKLCGKQARKERMKWHPRIGLAITDELFMISDDCKKWQKFDEAFVTGGIENGENWIYGDGYLAYALLDDGNNYAMYRPYGRWSGKPAILKRHTIRKDGFAYYYAPYSGKKVVTKYFKCSGSKMFVNFSTSAKGNLFITITDKEGNSVSSCEMFGDSIRREVSIPEKEMKKFIGKEICVTFSIKDASVYSFLFE